MIAIRSAPFLVAAFWTAVTFAQPAAPVTLSSGRITGTDLGTVQSWLGIPYAAPPIGATLRWKAPRALADAWDGVARHGPLRSRLHAIPVEACGREPLSVKIA